MKKYILLFLLCFSLGTVYSQSSLLGLHYTVGVPTGSLSDFVESTSYAGFKFDYQGFVRDYIALGFAYQYQGYEHEFDRKVYEFDNGALRSKVWDYAYFNRFIFTGKFYPETSIALKPYLGAGLGFSVIDVTRVVGLFSIENDETSWYMGAQAGTVIWLPGNKVGLYINFHYNYETLETDAIEDAQSYTIGTGVIFNVD